VGVLPLILIIGLGLGLAMVSDFLLVNRSREDFITAIVSKSP